MSTTVVVTGLGATTPIGGDAVSTWEAALKGVSGAATFTGPWVDDFELPVTFGAQLTVPASDMLTKVQLRRLDPSSQYALIAAQEAWKDAGSPEPEPTRLGVCMASGIGGLWTLLDNWDAMKAGGPRRVFPLSIPMLMPNAPAATVSLEVGARAGAHTPVSACASGAEAIAMAIDMIRSGRADIVVAGGTEAVVHPLPVAAFAAMQALSTRNDDPATASRPYDVSRDGFVLGEGAGVVVLESEEHAQAPAAPGSTPTSSGPGMSSDAHHIAAPEPEGMGAARAIREALAVSGLEPSDVDHINAHATSTPVGDVAEARAIHRALGSDVASRIAVSATKSMTGHLLGAAGAVEAVFADLRGPRPARPADDQHHRDGPRRRARRRPRRAPPARRRHRPGRRAQQLLRLRRPQRRPHLPQRVMTATAAPAGTPRASRSTRATRCCGCRPSPTRAASSCSASPTTRAWSRPRVRVDGTPAVVFCSDARTMGGAMGEAGCKVVLLAYERALADGVPVVGLWHSGGARLAEGVVSLHAVGEVFAIMTRASGKIPQISVVIGAAAGGAAYGPALTDVVVLGPDGRVFVTGPDVVRSVTGEKVDALRLGGPEPHGRRSGVVHVTTETTEDAYLRGRELVTLLGTPRRVDPAAVRDKDLGRHLPENAKRAYDVHPIVADLLDDDAEVLELHARWAPNVVTTLGRLGGGTVGVVANNPMRLGGCLDSTSAEKAARFVRMCDAFGIPLVVLVDVPGLPARRRPGVGRRRAPRRQAAPRLRRGHRPPGHPGHPQGLRRRVHRHELPLARRDPRLRVADGRGGRHGRRRRGPDPPPPPPGRGAGRRPRPGRGRAGRRARAPRRRHPPRHGDRRGRRDRRHGADPLGAGRRPSRPPRPSAASTATSRCRPLWAAGTWAAVRSSGARSGCSCAARPTPTASRSRP